MSAEYPADHVSVYAAAGVLDVAVSLDLDHDQADGRGYLIGHVILLPGVEDIDDPLEVFVTSPHDTELEGIHATPGWCITVDDNAGHVKFYAGLEEYMIRPVLRALLTHLISTDSD